MLIDGLLDLSFWGYLWITLLLTHVTIACVTIFLHRHQAHRALTLHPVISHFFRFWLWMTTGMVTREWAAVHRKHHARCELDDDPHSPQVLGIRSVLFGGTLLYRKEASNPETVEKYGRGTPDDWIERNLYSRFRFTGVFLTLAIDVVLFGLAGLAIWAVQMVWIPFWAAGVINGIGHFWGYRNFETRDASRNIVPWGILIGGEELHNNHHAYGSSARLSNKWWEFDIGWLYIRLLEIMGLAKVCRAAPKTSFAGSRPAIDMEMVKAIVSNRFHVLKLYGSRVVRPVFRAEYRDERGSAKRRLLGLRRLITAEDAVIDVERGRELKEFLDTNQAMRTVYDFKVRLKALWDHHSRESSEVLARLQSWCSDAEASGIASLQIFAQQLRGYRAQHVGA